ncbi:MAG: glutathione S-transferase family protein [Parvularculaceae bacterium]
MILYGSMTSPFVRTVRIAAIELGLGARIELTMTVVKPTQPNRDYGTAVNPLRRVPALETDDGDVIVDSRVIVEYLNGLADGPLIPKDAGARIDCLNRHAIVSGATEALVSAMYEMKLRPEERRWKDWADDQIDKAEAVFAWADANIAEFGAFDLSAIALVCLLDYTAFRFAHIAWLKKLPAVAAFANEATKRASVRDTAPRE